MRRIVSVMIAMTLLVSMLRTAKAERMNPNGPFGQNGNCVLFAKEVSINGSYFLAPEKTFSHEEVLNGLLSYLKPDTEKRQVLSSGAKEIQISKATYVAGNVSFSGDVVNIAAPIVSEGDITISASNVNVTASGFLVSKNGSVNIHCTNLTVNGPIVAGKKVFITGNKATVNEAVFARNIECYISAFLSDNTVNETILKGARDKVADISICSEDERSIGFVTANFDYISVRIYAREKNDTSYFFVKSENDGEWDIPEGWNYVDYAAIVTNEFGYAFRTNPVSVEVIDGVLLDSIGVDSDEDGVADAIEIWLTGTNPHEKNVFNNSDFYVNIADDHGTVCYDRIYGRDVKYTTEDYTKEYCYGDFDYPQRVSSTIIRYSDGSIKQIRYEYEDNRLKNLYVGGNKYAIEEDEDSIRYVINNTCIKQIHKTEWCDTINHFDNLTERYQFDSEANLVSYENDSLYRMTYDDLDLLIELTKDGAVYAEYTYDDYGNFMTIDAKDYSIRYSYQYPIYQADYTFGLNKQIQKSLRVPFNEENNTDSEGILLIDGTNGRGIPTTKDGEILSVDTNAKTVRYRIGTKEHLIQFDARGYVVKESSEGITNEYQYDPYGNIIKATKKTNNQTYVYDYTYDSLWSDELVSFDGHPIQYSSLGRPTEYYNGMHFTWAAGKLSGIVDDINQITYRYDYRGLREEKNVNGVTTRYIYEGRDLIAELSEDPIFFIYDSNLNLVGFEWGNDAYYYQFDIFGDVIGIIDVTGRQLCSYSYDLWGEIIEITGDLLLAERNPIRYRGYYYDKESGFYYLETRYYDPHVKRFLSYDDLESFFYGDEEEMESLFAYCRNNPVLRLDQHGTSSYTSEILTISEFTSESYLLQSAMNSTMSKFFYAKGKKTKVYTFKSSKEFIDEWNRCGGMDVVVVNAHGNYWSFGNLNDSVADITISTIKNQLKTISVKALWLLPCHNGLWEKRNENIARAFSKKITGTVVAADGSVKMVWYSWGAFDSDGSLGWCLYRASNYGSTINCVCLNKTRMSFTDLLRTLGMVSS